MMLTPCSFALLRTPLQSLRLLENPTAAASPLLDEGLYLASPEFHEIYKRKDQANPKEAEKLARAFSKYWIRSCTRCTPYGTFAGSSVIDLIEGNSQLVLADSNTHTRRTRIDTAYVAAMIAALVERPTLRNQLRYFPNNSLYELPDSFRYAEYTPGKYSREYKLASVGNQPYLKAVLQWAARGATHDELAELLQAKESVSRDEAMTFINAMEKAQLIVSELEPCVTGDEPFYRLIEQLDGLKDVGDILPALKRIQHQLRQPPDGVAYYQAIAHELQNLNLIPDAPKYLLQTDLFLNMEEPSLDVSITNEILNQISDLARFPDSMTSPDLEDFCKRFYDRYEAAEVPLALALDADLGIGYGNVRDEDAGGSELIDALAVASHRSGRSAPLSLFQQLALEKYHEYLRDGQPEIELKKTDLDGLKSQRPSGQLPNSMYVMGSLIKKEGRLDPTHFTFSVMGLGGPSAGNMMGRFTHGDARLCELVKGLLKAEEMAHPEAIYAEIVHLPQTRIGNILLRPPLRDYEIPYVGNSGAPESAQIPLEDLLVRVYGQRVYLRSKKLNKQVIPRLTTAHNYSSGALPIYKFLCDLQSQGAAYATIWDWGPLRTQRHLPRVTYKNLILKKAQWTVTAKDIADLPADPEEQAAWAGTFCEARRMPQRVVLTRADNDLLLDLATPEGISLLRHYIERFRSIVLEEFLFTEDNCVVTDEHGAPYTNELIIPLTVTEAASGPGQQAALPAQEPGPEVRRRFAPGSEWQYFKLYCGSKTAEKILRTVILPFVEDGRAQGLFERFFFLRYRDESGPHLRIRFFNTNRQQRTALQDAFLDTMQPLLHSGAIHRVCIDTYNRELERYGAALIEETETLYYNDSLAMLRFLDLLDGPEHVKYRLLFALRSTDVLLADFSLTLPERHTLLKTMQAAMFREFGGSPSLQKQLNEKYRDHQRDIFSHLDARNDAANEIEDAVALFHTRSRMNAPAVAAIPAHLQDGRADARLHELLSSYVHLSMNRLFIAQQRKYELVVYHFLEKYYSSQLAIGKKNAAAALPRPQTA